MIPGITASAIGGGGGGPTDPNFASVSLLLHMDGSDGSTTFTDNSPSPRTMTANGNAQIDTAQSQFGGASGLFDGAGDWVSTPSNAVFNMGTGSFTAEGWIRPATNSVRIAAFGQIDSAGQNNTGSFIVELTATGKLRGYSFSGSSVIADLTGGTTVSINTWHHIAYVRSGTTFYLFLDGAQEATVGGVSGALNSSSNTFSVGRAGEVNAIYWSGHLDDIRITKGVARYTSAFTPPNAAFPDS
jgi:hypothetical protein